MNRSTHHTPATLSVHLLLRQLAVVFALALTLAVVGPGTQAANAQTESVISEAPTSQSPRSEHLVFSMGILAAVDGQTVTVAFEDGAPETYRVGPDTTIQSQNGDAQRLTDLEVGNAVVVLSREGDPTALTIVNGGDTGFHEAGPADLRGHEDDACLPCDAPGGR